jgi:16S rRNA G1207 methylase RsmC
MGLGLQKDDPGVAMLGRTLASCDPGGLLLVHCGDLPQIRAGATRLVLDCRELEGSSHRCIPLTADTLEPGSMDFAAVWPRAHLGKDFHEACLARAAVALRPGGELLCAIKKRRGADSLRRTLTALMGHVDVVARGHGYRLFRSIRNGRIDDALAQRLLSKRYTIEDPLLGDLVLSSAPGVFARKGLDSGTRCLIEHVAGRLDGPGPRRVIDLCAGVGPLALWAARRWPDASVLAVDSSYLAVALLEENARAASVHGRVRTVISDGMPDDARLRETHGRADLALVNPPTHAAPADLARLLEGLRTFMAPRAPAAIVVNRSHRVRGILDDLGADVRSFEHEGFTVLEARFHPG